jgi:hypothetical protein
MIKYTEKQMELLRSIVLNNPVYSGDIIIAFMLENTGLYNDQSSNWNKSEKCYQQMKKYPIKKVSYTNERPDKESSKAMEEIRKVMFEIEKDDLPLYINYPIAGPIAAWRLENNI